MLSVSDLYMELTVQNAALLLLIAIVVAILTQRLNLPYSVGLVAAGIALAFLRFSNTIALTKDLLFTVLLPPLIFQAAFYLDWRRLRRDLGVIVVLATLGVILSAGITTLGMHYLANWQWLSALVFGVLIAATDPVSVIATFQESGARGRLVLLVEAESLFNDGTAAVFFVMILDLVGGKSPSPVNSALQLLLTAGGGLFTGAAIAALALLLAGNTQDHLIEIALTTVAAYGSFLLAERFHMSGVLATLSAGLTLGNLGKDGRISDRGREAVQDFWGYAAFVANSLIFLLIGMHVEMQDFGAVRVPALIAILLVTLGRAAAVYPCCALFLRSRQRVPAKQQHILFWGGLRGALALALALALPAAVPERETIIAISFAVVAFSIFVQGLTMKPILRAAGELPR
ncbi:MAG TPA: sodium:proton antiporter [Bryobacteraceae bacterium]|jgi:CPA1 family monovalent cation:H+ antiporter|nr:sodium:proton antiporter [Bryobacteraceae bacterium]